MDKNEIIERLKNIADHAVHTAGERPFIMSLDDGIAVHEAIELLEQIRWRPVSDTISRQAAIDALDFEIVHMTAYCDGKNEGNPFAQYNKGLEDGKKAIEALPPVQPEPQWIPVSERLPEKGGEYLVSVHHTIGAISVFHPEKDTYVDDVAIMKYYGKFPSTVRAWMPLPEAYKPNK